MTILLTSSNASKKYLTDVLESFSLPIGFVQHYRYHVKWLDPDLVSRLEVKPINSTVKTSSLEGETVIICYLDQTKSNDDGQYYWKNLYPYRVGTLMDAYKTGPGDDAVAHFYFKLETYIDCTSDDLTKILERENKYGDYYAFVSQISFNEYIFDEEENITAFHKLINFGIFNDIKSTSGESFSAVYCYVIGFHNSSGGLLNPEYDMLTKNSYYRFTEGKRYAFDFLVYFRKKKKSFSYSLCCDKRAFSTLEQYSLNLSSNYDEQSWFLIPTFRKRNLWTNINFYSDLEEEAEIIPLNINLNFPIKIKRQTLNKVVSAFVDVFIFLITLSLALSKLEAIWWWYIIFIPCFVLWSILTITSFFIND